jgi:hypothetical protein
VRKRQGARPPQHRLRPRLFLIREFFDHVEHEASNFGNSQKLPARTFYLKEVSCAEFPNGLQSRLGGAHQGLGGGGAVSAALSSDFSVTAKM